MFSFGLGRGQRSSTFMFELLDNGLNVIGEIDVVSPGVSIQNNINRKIKRTLSNFVLSPAVDRDINPITDRVRVSMIMEDETTWPLGVFLFSDTSVVPLTGTRGYRAGSLTDQSVILDQPTTRTYSFNPGSNIGASIQSMLQGLIPAYQVEVASIFVPGTEAMVWPAGTSRLDIVNDLCSAAGYYSLYFDNAGVAIARSVPDLAGVEATLRYGSIDPNEQRVYSGTITMRDDLLEAPNRYIVVSTGMNQQEVVGFWDIPSTAPNSKENRGYVVATVINKQGIDSNAAATTAAKAYGQSDYSTYSWATFDAAPDPRHDTFDVVAWEGVNYREQSWTLPCIEGGAHKHELRRIYNEDTFGG